MAEPVQNVHNNKWLSKIKAGATGAGVAAVAIAIAMFVPLIPITVEEEVQTMQTRTISEQVLEDREKDLFLQEDFTIQPNTSYSRTVWVEAGQKVEFEVRASDTVDAYIMSSKGTMDRRNDVSGATLSFTAPYDDNYRFIVENTGGVFGLGSKSVGLYSASATASWQEQVTNTHEVTGPVTEKKMVTKNVTVPELIMNSIRVPTIG